MSDAPAAMTRHAITLAALWIAAQPFLMAVDAASTALGVK